MSSQLQLLSEEFGVAPEQLLSMVKLMFPSRPLESDAIALVTSLAQQHGISITGYDLPKLYKELFSIAM